MQIKFIVQKGILLKIRLIPLIYSKVSQAILEHRAIGFLYKGESRLVQPYRLINHLVVGI